jgi:hypothetical protein
MPAELAAAAHLSESTQQQFLAHRVTLPADEDGGASHNSPAEAAVYWYPLHHLARWSGAVAGGAPAPVVKKAMAEAKAVLEARSKQHADGLRSVYRKIGSTMSVPQALLYALSGCQRQAC